MNKLVEIRQRGAKENRQLPGGPDRQVDIGRDECHNLENYLDRLGLSGVDRLVVDQRQRTRVGTSALRAINASPLANIQVIGAGTISNYLDNRPQLPTSPGMIVSSVSTNNLLPYMGQEYPYNGPDVFLPTGDVYTSHISVGRDWRDSTVINVTESYVPSRDRTTTFTTNYHTVDIMVQVNPNGVIDPFFRPTGGEIIFNLQNARELGEGLLGNHSDYEYSEESSRGMTFTNQTSGEYLSLDLTGQISYGRTDVQKESGVITAQGFAYIHQHTGVEAQPRVEDLIRADTPADIAKALAWALRDRRAREIDPAVIDGMSLLNPDQQRILKSIAIQSGTENAAYTLLSRIMVTPGIGYEADTKLSAQMQHIIDTAAARIDEETFRVITEF